MCENIQYLPKLFLPRDHVVVAISETEALYFGGYISTCYVYNDLTTTFTQKASPKKSKMSTQAGKVTLADGRSVVIAAGYDDGDEVEIYDIKADTWTERDDLKLPFNLNLGSVVVVDNRY